jgi:hypothetical protein
MLVLCLELSQLALVITLAQTFLEKRCDVVCDPLQFPVAF